MFPEKSIHFSGIRGGKSLISTYPDGRPTSGLSWPSSYRSSRLLTPDEGLLSSDDEDALTDPIAAVADCNVDDDDVVDGEGRQGMMKGRLKLPPIFSERVHEGSLLGTSSRFESGDDLIYQEKGYNSTAFIDKSSSAIDFGYESIRDSETQPSFSQNVAMNRKPTLTGQWPPTAKKTNGNQSQRWKRGNNQLDNNTIYSNKQRNFMDDISKSSPGLLPPIETNNNSGSKNLADATKIKEKEIVLRDFFLTGRMKRFEDDKVVLPTVYKNVLDCSDKKRNYITTLYSKQYIRDRNGNLNSPDCSKRRHMPYNKCEFCDVMGNKYCSFCIEFKNRHFALAYEMNFMPKVPSFRKGRMGEVHKAPHKGFMNQRSKSILKPNKKGYGYTRR